MEEGMTMREAELTAERNRLRRRIVDLELENARLRRELIESQAALSAANAMGGNA